MNKVNQMVICKEQYETKEQFRQRFLDAMIVIIKSGYICTVFEEETDIIVINYDYADQSYGGAYPRWLTPEQEEMIILGDESTEDADTSS